MKKKPKTTQLERTAYHEAGHAVMHLEEKLAFEHVTIVPNEERRSLGHLIWKVQSDFNPEISSDRKTLRLLESMILCSLAGPAAEAIYAGRRNWRGAAGDLEAMVARAIDYTGSPEEANAFVNWLWIRANNTMKAQWPTVEAVAEALLAKKTLSTREVKKAIKTYFESRFGKIEIKRL